MDNEGRPPPPQKKFSTLGKAPELPADASPSAPPKPATKRKPARPDKPLPAKPPTPAPKEPEPAPQVPDKRTFIARELLSTEESYVDGLDGLMKMFEVPLRESGCLSALDMNTLFQNIGPLLSFHTVLRIDLTERLKIWDSNPCLGDLLVKAIPYLKLYISYVNNFNKVQQVLEGINKNQKALQILMGCQHKQMQGPLGLSSLLMTPIQRIPRYVLLLKDLLEKTPDTHADHSPLNSAYKSVCEIASVINERKRQEENVQKIAEIYSKLDEETKDRVTEALVENPHSWEKGKADTDLTCILCQKEIPKGQKVYRCEACQSSSHGAPKKCYEKVPKTCGMADDMANLVRAGRSLLRTGSAEHRAVHTADQYDGVATNKFSKEIQEKKKADLFLFDDVILILWEKKLEAQSEDHSKKDRPKGIKALMATSPYEFCALFYFYNRVKKEVASVKRLAPTVLEIHPPTGGVVHSLYFDGEDACGNWLELFEVRIKEEEAKHNKTTKVVIDEHGSEVDQTRPVWFTLPSTCPVPDGNGGSFMAYIVNIKFRDSDQEKVVLKRYNQFWILHQKLKKQVGKKNLPYFPPKKWVGNMKPKFVVKRRAELSHYLNKLDVDYLQLPDVKHFLSTGCETMEGEVGEGGGFDLETDDSDMLSSTATLPTSTMSTALTVSMEPEGNFEGEEEEEPLQGPYYAKFDFIANADEELTVYKGDEVMVNPAEDDTPWIYCQKGEELGYVPRKYLQDEEGREP